MTISGAIGITANSFKELLLGKSTTKKTLIEAFEYHNSKVKSQVGKGKAIGTYKHYEVGKKKLVRFLKHAYNTNDVLLDNLSHKFLVDFTTFLMNVDNLSSNSAMKKLTHLKTVVSMARANGWTNNNPFSAFKCTYKNPQREVLSKECDKGEIHLSIDHNSIKSCFVKLVCVDKINSAIIKKKSLDNL